MNDHLSDRVVALGFVQPLRRGDAESPVIEPHLGRGYIGGLDYQTYVASQIRQRFSTDEAFRRCSMYWVRDLAEYPGALLRTMA